MKDAEQGVDTPIERVAEDLATIYAEAEKLRRLVEQRIERWATAKEKSIGGWSTRLEAFRRKLEDALAEVDRRTDELAERHARCEEPGPAPRAAD